MFSEATSKVAAFLVDSDGKMFTIKQENIPSDLSKIDTVEKFEGFLGSVHARGAVLSDGEPKLYIEQRGLGGMDKAPFGKLLGDDYKPQKNALPPVISGSAPSVPRGHIDIHFNGKNDMGWKAGVNIPFSSKK